VEEGSEDADGVAEADISQAENLQYFAFDDTHKKHQHRMSQMTTASGSSAGNSDRPMSQQLGVPRSSLPRPSSAHVVGSEVRGRALSPLSANGSQENSPARYAREISASRRSPASRPTSYIDLLNNVPYSQQVAPGGSIASKSLQSVVGSGASLLDAKKTLEMYRANVKKTNDAAVQYEFAVFMINSAQNVEPSTDLKPDELISEAKHILQRLADRVYPFAQYYLGDGYFSGLFNKDKPDYDKAFTLFVAASKHGHAEAGYRAALCYEFGWGTTKSYPKAVQFYRNSASKNHPGAATRLGLACIQGGLGLPQSKYREGFNWLKRAQESADFQYNNAPYELGLLHLTGYKDVIFKDERYAAQLFTQSAELGHVQANFLMGKAYEEGLYGCPRDASLSVHFYNGAATRGMPEAMMALCAWYMVGAEPVLEKDEVEAYAWAMQAAETGMIFRDALRILQLLIRGLTADIGFPKAEYAVAYFTEMGIGCRRDPLEANVWYVRAAENGNENAKQRLQIIRAAAQGLDAASATLPTAKDAKKEKKKFMGIF
jgi:TPR repeat protein